MVGGVARDTAKSAQHEWGRIRQVAFRHVVPPKADLRYILLIFLFVLEFLNSLEFLNFFEFLDFSEFLIFLEVLFSSNS